ncbi:M23 family metallopeptidase [Rheinheimera sp. WS51]|uniref:M23 family metallopeptidase n=1 Tax=Rheinheimera sp. WS51 TaxID=3425886 RepID=UPI003D914F3C
MNIKHAELKSISSKLLLAIALGGFSTFLAATPQLTAEQSIVAVKKQAVSITKQQLLYDYDEMLSFDVKDYLQQHAPHLVDYAEIISHHAGYSSISPKLLIALIEQQSGIITKPGSASAMAQPFARLSAKTSFAEQVEDVSQQLAQAFYQGHSYSVTGKNEKFTTDIDASRALGQLLAKQAGKADRQQAATLQKQTADLMALYNKLFKDVVSDSDREASAYQQQNTQAITDINSYFQLPFPTGDYWRNGGSHTNTGSGSYPQSSLDFNQGGYWGDNLSHIWVASVAPGTVKYHSSCFMEVIHQDGWSSTYYHLSNIQYGTGAYVERNVPIANYASNRSQALCNGGASTGPHLHFSMKRNGQFYHLNGMSFSDYKVNTGRNSYDDSCNYFWLAKGGQRYCAWSRIYNGGVSDTTPPDNGTTYTGYLSHRSSQIQPDGSWFSYRGGMIKANLTGPSNADFELRLERWDGYRWYSVASSTSPTSTESISYNANNGYYRVIVYSYSGSGDYTLTLIK